MSTAPDRLLPPRKAAEMLGIHVDDLGELRRRGLITGVIQRIRGTKGRPRHYYRLSEVTRYIDGLETSEPRKAIVIEKRSPRRSASRGKWEEYV